MHTRFPQISNLSDLRTYVNETLCDRYELQTDAFEMTERIPAGRAVPVGCTSPARPRAVKFTAIWETDY